MIYLDNNSTTVLDKLISKEIDLLQNMPLNPSSIHILGQKARKILEDARGRIKKSLKAYCHDVIFTASGTEANNMVFRAFDYDYVFVATSEHESVLQPALCLYPNKHVPIPIDANGQIDIENLENLIRNAEKSRFLVSVMLANNETGIIQTQMQKICEITHKYGGLIHSDCIQYLGKEYLDCGLFDFDFISIASHKIHGPLGVAALIVRSEIDIRPTLFGGGQESYKRPSTYNLPAIHGFSLAVENKNNPANIESYKKHTLNLKNILENEIKSRGGLIFGENTPRLSNTSFFAIPNIENKVQIIECDLNGICISNGSACSSGSSKSSHVLQAMGYENLAKYAIRVSTCMTNTAEDIYKLTRTVRYGNF